MLTFQQIILALNQYLGPPGLRAAPALRHGGGRGDLSHGDLPARDRSRALERGLRSASRRPKDGRYGENPNRLQHYYQYQVVMKPSPDDLQDLYLESLTRSASTRS